MSALEPGSLFDRIPRTDPPDWREAALEVGARAMHVRYCVRQAYEPIGQLPGPPPCASQMDQHRRDVVAILEAVNMCESPFRPGITCPICGRTSYNLNDVVAGYCGHCHEWHPYGH